jgi:hypothetical protein
VVYAGNARDALQTLNQFSFDAVPRVYRQSQLRPPEQVAAPPRPAQIQGQMHKYIITAFWNIEVVTMLSKVQQKGIENVYT